MSRRGEKCVHACGWGVGLVHLQGSFCCLMWRTASWHMGGIGVLWLGNLELMLNLILFGNAVMELSIIWKL